MKTTRLTLKELALRLALVGGSLLSIFLLLEFGSRLFFPDRELRYSADPHSLWYFAPDQDPGTSRFGREPTSPKTRINRLGFRGADFSEAGGPFILTLGNSFTFGSGVADDETFTAQLDRAWGDQGTVANGGQPGYGVFQMLAHWRRTGAQLRPEAVILVLWQGDFLRQPPSEADRERYFRRKRQSELVRKSLLFTHLYRSAERLFLQRGWDNLVVRVADMADREDAQDQSLIDMHLRGMEADLPRIWELHEEASVSGRGLLLVLWPKEGFASVPPSERDLAEVLTDRLSNFAAEHGIPFISAQPALEPHPSPLLLIPDDWHPTPFAHCVVAQHIGIKLVEMGLTFPHAIVCRPDAEASPPAG